MSILIQPDIKILRQMFDEALEMHGIEVDYQYPMYNDIDVHGAAAPDCYSVIHKIKILFETSPKITTFRRLGWTVENDENLPFLVHMSFNTPNLQKNCILEIHGQYTGLGGRKFQITKLSEELQAPDHVTATIVPMLQKELPVKQSEKDREKELSTSRRFVKGETDYRGDTVLPKVISQNTEGFKC